MDVNLFKTQLKDLPYLDKVKLSQILKKEGENLNYWIKKLLLNKTLITLKKGLYTSSFFLLTLEANPFEKEKYCEYLANLLRYPSYISLEYLLSKYGLIPEAVFAITSVTLKSSRTFSNPLGNFTYRKIKPEYFNNFQSTDFKDKKVYLATPAKALFDFFYFKKFLSGQDMLWQLTEGFRINWDNLDLKNKKDLENILINSKSPKMKKILKILKREKIL